MDETTSNYQDNPFIEEIEHTADFAIRVKAKTIEGLFKNAASGMLQLIQISSQPGDKNAKSIVLSAIDNETLLVTWLEELLFEMETNNVAFTDIEVQSVEKGCLKATVHEVPLLERKKEIKAVTFNDLSIEATNDGFSTTIVFDV